MPGNDDYFFEHVLTREAAYRALLRTNRRMLHGLAAHSLAALIKPGTTDEWNLLPHLIEHLALAEMHAEAHVRCCELLYLAAGSGRHELFNQYEAQAEKHLRLVRGTAAHSAALELARGERIYLRFEYSTARSALEHAYALAETEENHLVQCRALRRLAALALHRGESETALGLAQRSLELGEELGLATEVSTSLSLLGLLNTRVLRNYAAAEQLYLRALEHARSNQLLRAETVALNNYGLLLSENLGRRAEACTCWEQALVANRAVHNFIGEAINCDNLGGCTSSWTSCPKRSACCKPLSSAMARQVTSRGWAARELSWDWCICS